MLNAAKTQKKVSKMMMKRESRVAAAQAAAAAAATGSSELDVKHLEAHSGDFTDDDDYSDEDPDANILEHHQWVMQRKKIGLSRAEKDSPFRITGQKHQEANEINFMRKNIKRRECLKFCENLKEKEKVCFCGANLKEHNKIMQEMKG